MKTTLDLPEEAAPCERIEVGNDGLPVIRCRPEAPAAGMTVAELLALERDADCTSFRPEGPDLLLLQS